MTMQTQVTMKKIFSFVISVGLILWIFDIIILPSPRPLQSGYHAINLSQHNMTAIQQPNVSIANTVHHNKVMNSNWNTIIRQRDKMPSKCDHSKDRDTIQITPVFHNWAPFWLRCAIPWGTRRHMRTMFLTKEINYIHVFKAAGTTINSGLERLSSQHIINITKYNTSRASNVYGDESRVPRRKYLKFINDQTFVFTFIRDPISKFLAGFFEQNRKLRSPALLNLTKYDLRTMKGIDILRLWIGAMLDNLRKYEKLPKAGRKGSEYLDAHTTANVNVLSPYKKLLNFVGVVSNLNHDLPQLLQPFIRDQRIRNNATLLMREYFIHRNGRMDVVDPDFWMARHGFNLSEVNVTNFDIKISDLNDSDVKNLCQIYWIEYICFPWDVPDVCNLTDLFIRHYGKHVQYKPCY
eukprot:270584_1